MKKIAVTVSSANKVLVYAPGLYQVTEGGGDYETGCNIRIKQIRASGPGQNITYDVDYISLKGKKSSESLGTDEMDDMKLKRIGR